MRALIAAAAALAVFAAPAAAAPNRSHTFDVNDLDAYGWTTDAGTGALATSTVSNKAACTQVLQSCDFTLIQLTDPGTLTVTTSSTDKTLVDADLHLYTSDATGAQGDLVSQSNGGSPSEAVSVDGLDPGFYLVKIDWFVGYGSVEAKASYAPPVPDGG
jgi:hypothetical protein